MMEFKVEQIFFPALGVEKKIHYYAPRGEIAGVVYFHDGQNLYDDALTMYGRSWRLGAFLEKHPEYQKYAVVGIEHGEKRLSEYSPWPTEQYEIVKAVTDVADNFGGQGFAYLEDLVNTVIPWFEHRVGYTGGNRLICGSSMGGLISLVAGFEYPNVFPKVVALSSALWFAPNAFFSYLETKQTFPDYTLITFGDSEAHGEVGSDMYTAPNNQLDDYFAQHSANYDFMVIYGGRHHESDWEKCLPEIFQIVENQ